MEGWTADPPAAAPSSLPKDGQFELIQESATARVRRWRSPGDPKVTLIVKDPLGPGAAVRLRRERGILERLDGVAGVPRQRRLGEGVDAGRIVEEDVGDVCLAQAIPPGGWHVAQVIGLGIALARTLAEVHNRGVIHRDVTPFNVVLSQRQGGPVLVDFDLATTYAQERSGGDSGDLVGTLPYLAPEQTGRTGRVIDHRADLYGLGATLYEAACGHPPFGRDDPLRLIHDQLTRVPVPLDVLRPELPESFSRLVARLLEKEPDHRYQSAEGLLYDLTLLRTHLADGRPGVIRLGERDFPLRLSAPSQPIGRDEELAVLRSALETVTSGGGRCVLVAGAPGVGKSALLNELRRMSAEAEGWFAAGKFDEVRQDPLTNALAQVMRALGRLLLAEPEDRLAGQRASIVEAVGANASLLAVFPEFAVLLGVPGDLSVAGLAEMQARLVRACADVLRVVASPRRPLVVVLDDLQWASSGGLELIDTLLTEQLPSGLLLAGAYRDEPSDAGRPLRDKLARWQALGVLPVLIRLDVLGPDALRELLALMLRLPPARAAELATAIGEHTLGNPFDTVELVNALRSQRLLVPGETGWVWEAARIHEYAAGRDAGALVVAQLEGLPAQVRAGVELLACLGVQVPTAVLAAATGLDEAAVVDRFGPALECGLLVQRVDAGGRALALSFRHDQTRQAVYRGLSGALRARLHLDAARHLAGTPETENLAAEHYLHATEPDTSQAVASVTEGGTGTGTEGRTGPGEQAGRGSPISDPAERVAAARLAHRAGRTARLTNPALSERLLVAAGALIRPEAGAAGDEPLAQAIDVDLHATLYQLGRLEDLDRLYPAIAARCRDPLDLVAPACVQIAALTSQARSAEATALGVHVLAEFGVRPPEGLTAWVEAELDALSAWAQRAGDEELARPPLQDPRLRAVAELIHHTLAPAFLCDPGTHRWLMLTGQRMWMEYGPCPELVYAIGSTAALLVGLREDYRAAYRLARLGESVGEAHGYEPATSAVRFLSSACVSHWFEPLEDEVGRLRTARERLMQGGDPTYAVMTANVLTGVVLDVEPTLDACGREAETGLSLAARTGSVYVRGIMLAYRQLIRCLRGETHRLGDFDDVEFCEADHLADPTVTPMAVTVYHVNRALAAALLAQPDLLARHSALAVHGLDYVPGFWLVTHARAVRALAVADLVRRGAPGREELLAELDACRDWLAARAEDAPENVAQLLALIEAERHWARGELREAAAAFDVALRDLAPHRRAWQAALTVERAGVFLQDQGLHHLGLLLLSRARTLYLAWGARAKASQLAHDHAELRLSRYRQDAIAVSGGHTAGRDGFGSLEGSPDLGSAGRLRSEGGSSSEVTSGEVALSGVLAATRALGQETDLDRLCDRVSQVVGRLAAATSVRILLRNDPGRPWYLLDPRAGRDGAVRSPNDLMIALNDERAAAVVPLSAVRFVERTEAPLLVRDASQDDRFHHDPFVARRGSCSLMVVPLPTRGRIRAMLLLENRLSGSAFTPERLEAVQLAADHLAVSLEHALAERFRSLVHRCSDVALVCGREGGIRYASPAAAQFFGTDGAQLVGSRLDALLCPEGAGPMPAWLWQVTGDAGGDRAQPVECLVRRGDRELGWVEVSCTDLTADPIVGGLVVHLRDVRERRSLQDELRRAQRLEAIGQLAAGITHEIKTPIQFVGDNLKFLDDAFTDLSQVLRAYRAAGEVATAATDAVLPPALVAAMGEAARAGADADVEFLLEDVPRAVAQSLEGVTQVSRIVQAMKASVHPGAADRAQIDLNELVRTTLVVAHNEVKYVADVRLELGELPPIWCYPGDVQQVVLNLVVNAAQAIGETVKAGGPRGVITVHTHRSGDEVVLEVGDTGPGIPQEIGERVFEAFFTTKPIGIGSGQGLAVVRKLITERHGGSISFSSPPGMGTTFTVRLPVGGPEEPPPPIA
ncbi:MAG TPA: AAA family ATPase [Kineosporiaceae bacterium]|nr:AAA family ATPase [Kineosporiaceae bacterium]